jgi:hypothetical protein
VIGIDQREIAICFFAIGPAQLIDHFNQLLLLGRFLFLAGREVQIVERGSVIGKRRDALRTP